MVQVFTPKKSKKDLHEVSQFGYIDLRVASQTGTIPGDFEGQDVNYNNIEDPASILGRPSDVFEAYRLADGIKRAQKGASAMQSQSPSGNNSAE